MCFTVTLWNFYKVLCQNIFLLVVVLCIIIANHKNLQVLKLERLYKYNFWAESHL